MLLLNQANIQQPRKQESSITCQVEAVLHHMLPHPVAEEVDFQHQQEVAEVRSHHLVVEEEVLDLAVVPAAEHSTDSMRHNSGTRHTLHKDQHLCHTIGHIEPHSRLVSAQSREVQVLKRQESMIVRSCLGIGSSSFLDLFRHRKSHDLHSSFCCHRMNCCSRLHRIHLYKTPSAAAVGWL